MAKCGINPLADLAVLVIENGATSLAEFKAEMKIALGADYDALAEGMNELYSIAVDIFANEQPEAHIELMTGTGELIASPTEAEAALLKAEAGIAAMIELDEAVDHRDVYRLVHALILNGVHGEAKVMREAHKIIAQYDPTITERDVRRIFVQYGQATHPSPEADKKELREIRTLVRLQEHIDRLKAKLDPMRTGPQRDKATEKIREKQRILNDMLQQRAKDNPVPSREKLAGVNEARVTRLKNLIKDLEKQLKTGEKPVKGEPAPDSPEVKKLRAKVAALREKIKEIEEAKKVKPTEDEIYNRLRGRQLQREYDEIKRRLKEKDYVKREKKPPPPLNEENKKLSERLVQSKIELHKQTADWERQGWPVWRRVWDYVRQSINLSRAIITSVDLSGFLRQGGFLIMANPSLGFKSFMPMVRAFHKAENARAVNDEILGRKNAALYKKAGLYLAEQDSAHPTKMEEVYQGRWQEKIPLVAGSGRAYVTLLNRLRADTFDRMVDAMYRKGQQPSIEELKHLAAYINTATGRSKMGPNNRFAVQGMSDIFFAPRWMISRFSMALGLPLFTAPKGVRKQIAAHYINYAVAYSTMMALTAFFYGEDDEKPPVEWDPTSTDFGKMKIGDTRLDMMSGLAQPIVLMNRLLWGSRKSMKGDIVPLREGWTPFYDGESGPRFGGREIMGTLGFYFWGKASPMASAITNSMAQKNVVGQTYEERGEFMREVMGIPSVISDNFLVVEAANMVIPLSIRDFADAAEYHGIPKATAMQTLATLGVSMNTYGERKKKDKKKKKGRKKTAPVYTGQKSN